MPSRVDPTWRLTVHPPREGDDDDLVAHVIGIWTGDPPGVAFEAQVCAAGAELLVDRLLVRGRAFGAGPFMWNAEVEGEPAPASGRVTGDLLRTISIADVLIETRKEAPKSLAITREWAKSAGVKLDGTTVRRIKKAIDSLDETEPAAGKADPILR